MKGDSSMSHAIIRGLAMAIATAPFLIACGGGKADNPGAINTPQCSGSSCGVQGPPATGAQAAALCPVTAAVLHPPTGTLPTAEQTRCAFILGAGTGTAAGDGQPYTTQDFTNNPNPPMILVGPGVAGGGIPGATVQFDGLDIPLVGSGIGAVPNRHFDFYPFLGFASTTTDITKLPGTYNGLLYQLSPSGNYATVATNTIETFDASGTCTSSNTANPNYSPNAGGCLTTGNPLTLNSSGYFDSQQAPQIVPQFKLPIIGATGKSATAHMILGQINGATVPLVVRTGFINLGTAPFHLDAKVDDESGIAMLAAATPLASGGFDGGYVGADSNFKDTATLIQGNVGTFINPTTSSAESGVGLGYGLQSPGLVGVQDSNG